MPVHCHHYSFSYEENVLFSLVFAIVYDLLDHLKPREESAYDLNMIKDFIIRILLRIFVSRIA